MACESHCAHCSLGQIVDEEGGCRTEGARPWTEGSSGVWIESLCYSSFVLKAIFSCNMLSLVLKAIITMSNNGLCALGDTVILKVIRLPLDPKQSIHFSFVLMHCAKKLRSIITNSLRYCPVNPKRSQD
jgi:hypothetical protein